MGRVPATPLDVESAEAAERAAAREREQLRIHNMNSLQWLAWQAEKAVESGLDTLLGFPTEAAMRPPGALREQSERQTHERERETKRRKRNAAKQPDSAAVASESETARIRTEFEKSAAAKRRALEILELQREEDEWEESLKATAVSNNKTIIQNTLAQMAGLYAVSQACLLSIFVPQKCPAICSCDQIDQCPADSTCLTSPWFSYPVNVAGGHLCSLKENVDWANDSQKNRRVIILNVVTLMVMLTAQAYFWKREVWMINALEEDQSVAYNHLPDELENMPEFRDTLETHNRIAFYLAGIVFIMVVVNFGVSTEFLINGDQFYNYNLGTRTITGLLTSTMLVSTKVIAYLSYARLSYANGWAVSLFTVVPLSYNRLDDTKKTRETVDLDKKPVFDQGEHPIFLLEE